MSKYSAAASAVLALSLLAVPGLTQEEGAAPVTAEGTQTVDPAALPSGEACDYPVDLLWNREPTEGDAPWAMGVSVKNKSSGQQVPGLSEPHFRLLLDGVQASTDAPFKVNQSARAFLSAETPEGEAPRTGVDPINYDVYFAVDMTASMGGEIQVEGAKAATKLNFALRVVRALVLPAKQGASALFDDQDRVYISGFTSRLETGFMDSTTTDRNKILEALNDMNSVETTGDSAALYASVMHNLTNIQARATEYSSSEKKREAVLIVLTDSFNGMDLEGRRSLRTCDKNDPLTDQVQQAIFDTQKATDGNLKVYFLGIGSESEPKYYSQSEPPNRRCRITTVEKETLDGRSLRVVGNPEITRGGYYANDNPRALMSFVQGQFEALKSAYEVQYKAPEGVSRPRSFQVIVSVGEKVCTDLEVLASNIIPTARAKGVDTTASEVAVFLAGLLITLLFVPRSLSNLVTLGGGGGSAPARKKKKRKRRK